VVDQSHQVTAALAAGEPALRSFVTGLRADQDAVTSGLSLRWSSGAVEGHVNRINAETPDVWTRQSQPCTAILLGRRTYQVFAPAWSGRTAEEDPGAPFMNESPKYVVSASLQAGERANSTILGPYRAEAIRDLKDRVDGGIYVSVSGTLTVKRSISFA